MTELNCVSVIVADDELHSRRYLCELIELDPRFELLAQCSDGRSMINSCRKLAPAAIFLDIEMPRLSGFDVLKELSGKDQMPIVVVASAFSEYAIQAFNCEVFDYLTKPINPPRFEHTLNRVFRRYQEKLLVAAASTTQTSESSSPTMPEEGNAKKKLLRTVHGQLFYSEQEIHFLESAGNYVKVAFLNEMHLVRETLANLFEELESPSFLRVHRSYVINLRHLRKLSTTASGQVELLTDGGEVIPVSRNRRKSVINVVKNYLEAE